MTHVNGSFKTACKQTRCGNALILSSQMCQGIKLLQNVVYSAARLMCSRLCAVFIWYNDKHRCY